VAAVNESQLFDGLQLLSRVGCLQSGFRRIVIHRGGRTAGAAQRTLHLRAMQVAQYDVQIAVEICNSVEIRRAERELHKGVMR
jgi:hypothetical protein